MRKNDKNNADVIYHQLAQDIDKQSSSLIRTLLKQCMKNKDFNLFAQSYIEVEFQKKNIESLINVTNEKIIFNYERLLLPANLDNQINFIIILCTPLTWSTRTQSNLLLSSIKNNHLKHKD